MWAWKNEYGDRILQQLRRMGSSCDWSRTRFTLDDGLARAVRHNFVKLYREGLIFRGVRIIHLCPRCEASLADEAERREGFDEIHAVRGACYRNIVARESMRHAQAGQRKEASFADPAAM